MCHWNFVLCKSFCLWSDEGSVELQFYAVTVDCAQIRLCEEEITLSCCICVGFSIDPKVKLWRLWGKVMCEINDEICKKKKMCVSNNELPS